MEEAEEAEEAEEEEAVIEASPEVRAFSQHYAHLYAIITWSN